MSRLIALTSLVAISNLINKGLLYLRVSLLFIGLGRFDPHDLLTSDWTSFSSFLSFLRLQNRRLTSNNINKCDAEKKGDGGGGWNQSSGNISTRSSPCPVFILRPVCRHALDYWDLLIFLTFFSTCFFFPSRVKEPQQVSKARGLKKPNSGRNDIGDMVKRPAVNVKETGSVARCWCCTLLPKILVCLYLALSFLHPPGRFQSTCFWSFFILFFPSIYCIYIHFFFLLCVYSFGTCWPLYIHTFFHHHRSPPSLENRPPLSAVFHCTLRLATLNRPVKARANFHK